MIIRIACTPSSCCSCASLSENFALFLVDALPSGVFWNRWTFLIVLRHGFTFLNSSPLPRFLLIMLNCIFSIGVCQVTLFRVSLYTHLSITMLKSSPDAQTAQWRRALTVIMVVSAYFVVSISMVFINKFLMTQPGASIPAPMFVVWYQCLFTVAICWAMGALGKAGVSFFKDSPVVSYDLATARKVLPLSIVFVGMVSFNQLCLQYVEVSFYNVARSLTIVFNVLLSYYILNQPTSINALYTLVIVIVGFFVGADGEVNFSMIGTVCTMQTLDAFLYFTSSIDFLNKHLSHTSFHPSPPLSSPFLVLWCIVFILCGSQLSLYDFRTHAREQRQEQARLLQQYELGHSLYPPHLFLRGTHPFL